MHKLPGQVNNDTSPPSRGAWIEINIAKNGSNNLPSPPSRGAWIEILQRNLSNRRETVAPLAGGVD